MRHNIFYFLTHTNKFKNINGFILRQAIRFENGNSIFLAVPSLSFFMFVLSDFLCPSPVLRRPMTQLWKSICRKESLGESSNEIKPLTTYNPFPLNRNKKTLPFSPPLTSKKMWIVVADKASASSSEQNVHRKINTTLIFFIMTLISHIIQCCKCACNLFKLEEGANWFGSSRHNIPGYCSQQSFQCCGFMRYKSNMSGCIECCLEQGQDISVPQPQKADIWTTYMHTQFPICYAPGLLTTKSRRPR